MRQSNEIIDSGSYNPGTKDFTTRLRDLPEGLPLFDGIHLSHVRGFNIAGNTIFNWPQARKLRFGIWEDAESYDNNITGNTINYFKEAGVLAQGNGTHVSDNMMAGDVPYDGNPNETMMQSFQSELTDALIESLK